MIIPGELIYFFFGVAASVACGLVYWLATRRREAVGTESATRAGAPEVPRLTESLAEVRASLGSLRDAVDALKAQRPRSFSQTITADGITHSRD
jgi:hypothetical protein